MGIRTDIATEQLDTPQARRVISKCRRGIYTVTGAAKKLGVARDVVAEWLEELRARELEQELWSIAGELLGEDSPLPAFVRRCCTVPFEYRHDAEMLWLGLSRQMEELQKQGHELDEFSDPEFASSRCEIVPADAARADWPKLIAEELQRFFAGETPPIARVTPLRARELQAMAAEVVWARADELPDPERARTLARALARLGSSIEEIRASLAALKSALGELDADMLEPNPHIESLKIQEQLLAMTDKPQAQKLPLAGSDTLTLRDEANAITAFSFRNSLLEDLHSRISDAEMRKLMIETSALVARWLYVKEVLARSPKDYHALLESYIHSWCPDWEREATHVALAGDPETEK